MVREKLQYNDIDVNLTTIIIKGNDNALISKELMDICNGTFNITNRNILQNLLLKIKIFKRIYLEKKYGISQIELGSIVNGIFDNDVISVNILSIGSPLNLLHHLTVKYDTSIFDGITVNAGTNKVDNAMLSVDRMIVEYGEMTMDTRVEECEAWDSFIDAITIIKRFKNISENKS